MPPRALALSLSFWAACAACSRPPAGSAGAPLPAGAASRTVRVGSAPTGAEVVVAGQVRCATPCTLQLDPGRYRVLVRKVGYLPAEQELEVRAEGEASLDLSLVSSH